MLKEKWYEIRPFRTDVDTAGIDNMYKILEHVEKFLLVIIKEDPTIRIFVRTKEAGVITLNDLNGVEILQVDAPDLESLKHYRKYSMKRHCAVPIIPKRMDITSIYRSLGDHVTGRAFLAIYLKKAHTINEINNYISLLSKGQDPESMFAAILRTIIYSEKTPSERKNEKIRMAKEKIAGRNVFRARMVIGAESKAYANAIAGIFPSDAFTSKDFKSKKLKKMLSGNLTPGLFGGKGIVLNADEISGFLNLPSNNDIASVEFEIGKSASKASGTHEENVTVDESIGIDDVDPELINAVDGMPDDMPDDAYPEPISENDDSAVTEDVKNVPLDEKDGSIDVSVDDVPDDDMHDIDDMPSDNTKDNADDITDDLPDDTSIDECPPEGCAVDELKLDDTETQDDSTDVPK